MAEEPIDPALERDFCNEEDFSCVFGFDENEAWSRLRSFSNVTKINLSSQAQEQLGMFVGRNISDEHQWKELNKDKLQQHLLSVGDAESKLADQLHELEPGAMILIEYVPDQSTQDDGFLVYADVGELNEASEIVRKLELLQRLKLKLVTEKIFKKKWDGACADREIGQWKRIPEVAAAESTAQFDYPVKRTGDMRLRSSHEARDGFVELVPFKWRNTFNMPRMITDRGTQVRPPAKSRFQQTDPTFPKNAATQYQFDTADSAIDPSLIPSEWLNDSTNSLSKEAQFNAMNMCKNEYQSISAKLVQNYQTPRMEELRSFMSRSMCVGRNVCSMDWHPDRSGILVASYTFTTFSKQTDSTFDQAHEHSEDVVNRMMFEKCPVLMWSFDDPLEPLLELKSIREVTVVSFCPYDGELLVGGLTNGQIVLWDLKGEIERVQLAKQAAHESNEIREQILQLLENPPEESVDRTVGPAALSSLEHASRGAISSIKWLPRNYCITVTGHLRAQTETLHRFLVTSSLDGSVCFWDLDFSLPALQKMIASKKGSKMVDKTIYQRVNNLFFPTFKLLCQTSIVCVIVDEAMYLPVPQDHTVYRVQLVKHLLQPVPMECKMSIMLGTFTGQLVSGFWEGYDFDQGNLVNDEVLQVSHNLNPIHDGPIVALERNPTLRDVFLSIGGHVLALWSAEDNSSPIFWRTKAIPITAARWSLNRVALFFIGMANGEFEVWDLDMKTFRACLSLNLGAEALTTISAHRSACGRHWLAIADGKANIRIMSLPPAFVEPTANEEDTLRQMIRHEQSRKGSQAAWIKDYHDRNPLTIMEPKLAEIDAKKTAQQNETGRKQQRLSLIDAAKKKKLQESEKRAPLSDRLEKQYREKHFQIVLKSLMERRNVSPERMAREMRPEVDRRKYDAEKRAAIDASISQAGGDFENVQRVLRPSDKAAPLIVEKREGDTIPKYKQKLLNFREVELEAKAILRTHYLPEMESFTEVLVKGNEQRGKVCVDVGANMEHLEGYENKRNLRRRGVAPRTLLEDLNKVVEEDGERETNGEDEVRDN